MQLESELSEGSSLLLFTAASWASMKETGKCLSWTLHVLYSEWISGQRELYRNELEILDNIPLTRAYIGGKIARRF